MSRRLEKVQSPVTIDFEGAQLEAEAGEPLACSLIANDESLFSRSVKYHRPRGPFCFTGGCSNCLMRVDGVPNVHTCLTPARGGMRLERQNAFPDASIDLFAANDLVFRKWFNHHEFLAGVPVIEQVMLRIARKLAGLGKLPEHAPPQMPEAVTESHEVVIVGGGASGLGAARRLTELSVPYLLLERDEKLGGRLINGPPDPSAPPLFAPALEHLRAGSTVLGLYADDGESFLATTWQGQLRLIFFKRLVLALGGHPTMQTFENNDLPGIFAASAVARLIRRHRVLPGERIAVVGEPEEVRLVTNLIEASGAKALAPGRTVLRAHGSQHVTGVTVRATGVDERFDCDAVAVCEAVSPAFELARAAGAKVGWHPLMKVFVVEVEATGRTNNPNVFAVGQLQGPLSPGESAETGRVAASALARRLGSS